MVIEGDNLQSMATLYRERGQVDLILADPPYNTGKDFRYNDKWDTDPNDPGLGEIVPKEDGARHTKWMRFMWPRLQMMKSMLKPGGVLAICIDHRELFRLGAILDDPEMFGSDNRLAIINWQRAATRRNDKKQSGTGGVSISTEYILIYAKQKEKATTGLESRGAQDEDYKNPDNDPNGDWYGASPWAPGRATHQGMMYGVQNPFNGQIEYPPGNQCWANEKATVRAWLESWGSAYVERNIGDGFSDALILEGFGELGKDSNENREVLRISHLRAAKRLSIKPLPELYFSKNGYGRPRKKTYLKRVKQGVVPTTFWLDEFSDDEPLRIDAVSWPATESGTSELGARELSALVGQDHNFETVKPLKLFEKVIQLWCPPDGLVLDPFAGSGTTGHAVLSLNSRSNSERRFILIEQGRPEKGDPYARSLTALRLANVIRGLGASGGTKRVPGGFRFVCLDRKVDAETLLAMERDELVDAIMASHYEPHRKRAGGLISVTDAGSRYLVARNADNEGFFLVWDGPERNTNLTEEVYEGCASEAKAHGLKPIYHIYGRLYLFQTENVHFYQIPDRILQDFGLDLRSESYQGDL